MSLFERFIAKGNEKADELAKEGAMKDGRLMAQARVQPAFTVWRENGKIVKYAQATGEVGHSRTRKGRQGSMEQCGVRQQTTIGVDAEEAATI